MIEPLLILTFLVSLIASTLSGIVGAGGGLIISPYMLLIGLPPASAVATPKLAGLGLGLGTITKFYQERRIDWRQVAVLLPLSLLASVAGSLLLIEINPALIRPIVIAVTLVLVLVTFFDTESGLVRREVSNRSKTFGGLIYTIIEILRAMIGSGISTINMAVLMKFFGLDAITANAVKRVVTFPALLISMAIYVYNDLIVWDQGIALLLGTIIGGYIGALLAIKKGNLFVKRLFLLVVVLMVVSLLFI
ncbi:sulfite exporter TauE/SafE family protein [Candidatus Saccharibacteria bacterium]|nr:sulfite exporter TauE/SafE family protein [Candidatus Saccharibacteria bacterium]